MNKEIKRIAVFTSGGDAPGMNAALRAVVRSASYSGMLVYGIKRGYEGMIDGELIRLERADVSNIIHRGGTFLKTARSERFRTHEGRKLAYETLIAHKIDGCIAIGGNGTFSGAHLFFEEYGIPFIGVPGTIDNDLFGTDFTIGFDTAVNTAIEAVDKIRDTADAHDRIFFIEVMGRHAGFIALNTGIGSGAAFVIIPESERTLNDLVSELQLNSRRKKLFSLVIVAEGSKLGGAAQIAQHVQQQITNADIKVTIIGHLQRGGSPTALDRVLASRLGHAAVIGLVEGRRDVMVGIINDQITYTPFEEAIHKTKTPNEDLQRLAEILAM
jgi:6-phosphofructokinase 1